MPYLKSELGLHRFAKFSLSTPFLVLLTQKKNQWQCPRELESTRRKRSYSPGATLITMSRLPD
jgi:hypothetical protein